MEDIAQLIFFIVIFVIYALGAILRKMNEWINQKRMQVPRPRRERDEERQAYPQRRTTQPTVQRQAPSLEPAREPEMSEAEKILQQLEAMLPPEVREARQRARREASSRQAPQAEPERPVVIPAPAPVRQQQTTAPPPARPQAPPRPQPPVAQPRPQRPAAAQVQERRTTIPQKAPVAPVKRAVPAVKQPIAALPYAAYEERQSILQRLGMESKEDIRRVFLLQEILKPPVAENPYQ